MVGGQQRAGGVSGVAGAQPVDHGGQQLQQQLPQQLPSPVIIWATIAPTITQTITLHIAQGVGQEWKTGRGDWVVVINL